MLYPLTQLLIFLFGHLVLGLLRVKSFKLVLFLSLVSGIIAWRIHQDAFDLPYALATHLFLLVAYLHFYVGVDRSVSVRILNELHQAPGQRLDSQQFAAAYPQKHMFEHRVQLMVENGWLRQDSTGLYATEKTKYLVLPTQFLRKLYGLTETW